MTPTKLREIEMRFARRYIRPGSGIFAVRVRALNGVPALEVTHAQELRLPVRSFGGLPVIAHVGAPGRIAVAPEE